MRLNVNITKMILTWMIVAITVIFVLAVIAAIKLWIDRNWAEPLAEYSAILIFLLTALLLVCFLFDLLPEQRDKTKSDQEQSELEEDNPLDAEFEELAPLETEEQLLGKAEDDEVQDIGTL
jgi:type VI protein secretion system component VasK